MADPTSMPGGGDYSPASIQQLVAEHSMLDSQLQQLHQKRHFSPEDELEATRLKKLKLHVKDAMRQLQAI